MNILKDVLLCLVPYTHSPLHDRGEKRITWRTLGIVVPPLIEMGGATARECSIAHQ